MRANFIFIKVTLQDADGEFLGMHHQVGGGPSPPPPPHFSVIWTSLEDEHYNFDVTIIFDKCIIGTIHVVKLVQLFIKAHTSYHVRSPHPPLTTP